MILKTTVVSQGSRRTSLFPSILVKIPMLHRLVLIFLLVCGADWSYYLICYVFVKDDTRLINHDEWNINLNVDDDTDYFHDDTDGLLNDQFRDVT